VSDRSFTPARAPWRGGFFRDLLWVLLLGTVASMVDARPVIPRDDSTVLAEVTPATRHAELATRQIASKRIDVALPLAQYYIKQARITGDLRFLGYAEAVLVPWVGATTTSADALVLHATVLQSRHDFPGALRALEHARALRPNDPQSWLTSATVLKVLGNYDQALSACEQVAIRAEPVVTELCRQSVRSLTGELLPAYEAISQIPAQNLPNEERAWRDSELGEMAVRLGKDDAAERWFSSGLRSNPSDFYTRAAYADVLLRNGRAREALELLKGQEGLEPLLLRIAIAQKRLGDPGLGESRARLAAAFAAEAQRGDGLHRREEARFLLDVQADPSAALLAARENWQVQRESEDVLVLIRAAYAAGSPQAAEPALAFVREHGMQDARITAVTVVRAAVTKARSAVTGVRS